MEKYDSKEKVAQLLAYAGLADKYTPEQVLAEFRSSAELRPYIMRFDGDTAYEVVSKYFSEWQALRDQKAPGQPDQDSLRQQIAQFLNDFALGTVVTVEQVLEDLLTNPELAPYEHERVPVRVMRWFVTFVHGFSHDERDDWYVGIRDQRAANLRDFVWKNVCRTLESDEIVDAYKLSKLQIRLNADYDCIGFNVAFRPYRTLDYIKRHYPNDTLEMGFYYWWVNEILPLLTEEHAAEFLLRIPDGEKYTPKMLLWALKQDHALAYSMCGGLVPGFRFFMDCWDCV